MAAPKHVSRLRLPRLLPVTIVVMAAVLVIKSGAVVEAATGGAAQAAQPVAPSHPATAPSPAPVPVPLNPGKQAEPSVPPACGPSDPPVSDSERQLLTDLRQRRLDLDKREAALAAREVTLAAVDARVTGRVGELTTLQQRLETLERDRKARDEKSWAGLVKLYETMKPRDAAVIFNDLDLPVLLPVVDRMKEAKAALIFAAMQPDRARQLTTELAHRRLQANSLDGPGKAAPGGAPSATTPKTPAKP